MRLHRCNRMVATLLAVLFTAATVAPARFHGCGMAAAEASDGVAGMAGHQHHDSPAPLPEKCHCVGQSCAAMAPALPATPELAIQVASAEGVTFISANSVSPQTRAHFTLHYAQPPPLA